MRQRNYRRCCICHGPRALHPVEGYAQCGSHYVRVYGNACERCYAQYVWSYTGDIRGILAEI